MRSWAIVSVSFDKDGRPSDASISVRDKPEDLDPRLYRVDSSTFRRANGGSVSIYPPIYRRDIQALTEAWEAAKSLEGRLTPA